MLIQMKKFNVVGTSLQGYLPKEATYQQVLQVFGMPQISGSSDDKVQVQWIGKIGNIEKRNAIFTIYDYKSDVEPEKCTDWHIGGRNEEIAREVVQYFKENVDNELGNEENQEETFSKIENLNYVLTPNKILVKESMKKRLRRWKLFLRLLRSLVRMRVLNV